MESRSLQLINRCLLGAATALLLTGCSTYHYRLVQPPSLATELPPKQVVRVHYEPLDYEFVAQRDHLVMRIINPTPEPITIVPTRSFVVDPEGESRPLPGRTIGPNSFVHLLLPPGPVGGRIRSGPVFGIGFGTGLGWHRGRFGYPYGGFYGTDIYWGSPAVSSYEVETPYDWDWRTGPARIHLSFERPGGNFEQELQFVREKTR